MGGGGSFVSLISVLMSRLGRLAPLPPAASLSSDMERLTPPPGAAAPPPAAKLLMTPLGGGAWGGGAGAELARASGADAAAAAALLFPAIFLSWAAVVFLVFLVFVDSRYLAGTTKFAIV